MLCAFALLLPLLVVAASASGQDKGKPKNPIKVTYHGQSFYTFTSSAGVTVAFDPHALAEYNRILGVRADIVCISHEHTEHHALISIENAAEAKVLRGLTGKGLKADWVPIDETIKDVRVTSVGLYHDNMDGMRFGKNTAFVIEMDGWRIVHLGDLGHELTARQLRQIGAADVVMIPVGGIYTLNGSDAKRVIEQLKPKEYIFPMHYGTKVFEDLLPIDEFLEDQPPKQVVRSDDNRMYLNKDAARPRPLIVQLHYWAKEEAKEKKDEKKEKKEKKDDKEK